MVTSHCALHRKDSLCVLAYRLCISIKGGAGVGGWGHPQGAVNLVVVRLGPWLAPSGQFHALVAKKMA